MDYMIEIKNVQKNFGQETIIDHVSISFEAGKIHGLIGRNGSGKTVLLKMICGLLKPDHGDILVNGKRIGVDIEVPDSLGAIIEAPGFLPYHNAYRNLLYLARLSKKADQDQIQSAMRMVGLDPANKKLVWKYSLGMKQRLGIAQAIMENPDLLIFDEPFNGLDKQGVMDMRTLFKKLRGEGKTMLLTTHNQQDIDELCDTLCEIDEGIIIAKY
jgi:ABC-2 type transport system ATP-binding protein